jgi:4-diphosphocytidyl-2-C-methyl-D-erythritol kinase
VSRYRGYAHEHAPAKVTLSLRVVDRLPDGYHELEALTVPANAPCDDVFVELRDEPGVEVLVEPAGSAPAGADNLAARAAVAVLTAAGGGAGARIGLRKEIPAGAGLGGGSADAAAVLRVLGRELDVDEDRLEHIATTLGSDVSFCLFSEPAWMRGRGEVIEPVRLFGTMRLLIATPPFRCSTAAVYKAWDDLGGPGAAREAPAPRAVAHLVDALLNDLEPAAEHVEPRLAEFRDALETAVARAPVLCGSGSSYAVCFDDEASWRRAQRRAERALAGATVHAATVE